MNLPQAQLPTRDNPPADASQANREAEIEQFSTYHHIEWYYQRQIAGTPSLGKPQRTLVDEWVSMVVHVYDQWPEATPILLLVDLRREVSPTPYQSAKAYELLDYKPQHRAYIAIITGNNLSGQITRLILQVKNRQNGQIQQFLTPQDGMEWLIKMGHVQL